MDVITTLVALLAEGLKFLAVTAPGYNDARYEEIKVGKALAKK
jgi:hypothetical protein